MPVKMIRLKSIEARRYLEPSQAPRQIRVDHNVTIVSISFKNQNNSTIDFQYTTNYGSIGIIRMEGELLFEDKNARKIADMWSKSRKMPDEVATHVHNAIIQACITEAVAIAKILSLPPPIPLPQIRVGKPKPPEKGGPEVA
ncbi:MAG TPA: hypothetical protein ENL44_01210 [Thermoplasmatales archaeon]|nr:hypothetical protein [Thermoplasmata archaeon]HHF58803.1 hypothetical protein [Thermoplasmatales archaeon]